MKILLAGHRSFAARGLADGLRESGHQVVCFSRGEIRRENHIATGPVTELPRHPGLRDPFDAVLNFIVLKGESVRRNRKYARALLHFCTEHEVDRLIHVSSISVYPRGRNRIDADAKMERVPGKKGTYGAWKVAADRELVEQRPEGLGLVLVRPGFILGPGLMNPVVGNALRLPSDRLLCLGNPRTELPVISRKLVHEALERTVEAPFPPDREVSVLLLASPKSPTRLEYLRACCEVVGAGTGVRMLPVPVWLAAGLGAELAARLIGKGDLEPLRKIRDVCARHTYDPSVTERRLGMDFRFDWRRELRRSLDGQVCSIDLFPNVPEPPEEAGGQVNFLGVGRIVGHRHLPALERLGHRGDVRGYDPVPGERHGLDVAPLSEAELVDSDLTVVASPGPEHADALRLLREAAGPVIVEKPLCYTDAEFEAWREFAAGRQAPVYACHDYRFKPNVSAMLRRLSDWPPGRLIRVDVLFQSPPVAQETSGWLRRERQARTLLMDYSLHFLDLACMFGEGPWRPESIRWELNDRGETSLVEGRLLGETYPVSFCLRQGFVPRTARVEFVFQNCTSTLRFFPDSLDIQRTDESFWHHGRVAWRSFRETLGKAARKARGRSDAGSHARLFGAALGDQRLPELEVEALTPFYRGLHALADEVYGDQAPPNPS